MGSKVGKKSYRKEFKVEVVNLALSNGISREETAKNVGIPASTLNRWIREYQGEGVRAFPGHGNPKDEELAELRAENKRLRQEREILKKATVFFARESGN